MNLHILGLFWAILIASNRLSLSRQVYNLGAVFDSPSAEAVEMDFKLSQAGGYELRPKMAEMNLLSGRLGVLPLCHDLRDFGIQAV